MTLVKRPDLFDQVLAGQDIHQVIPADGDVFALSTICQTCDQLAYWRIGIAKWEHA